MRVLLILLYAAALAWAFSLVVDLRGNQTNDMLKKRAGNALASMGVAGLLFTVLLFV